MNIVRDILCGQLSELRVEICNLNAITMSTDDLGRLGMEKTATV